MRCIEFAFQLTYLEVNIVFDQSSPHMPGFIYMYIDIIIYKISIGNMTQRTELVLLKLCIYTYSLLKTNLLRVFICLYLPSYELNLFKLPEIKYNHLIYTCIYRLFSHQNDNYIACTCPYG